MYYIKKGSFISADGRVEVCEPYCYLKKSFSSFDKAKEELKAIFEEKKDIIVPDDNEVDKNSGIWEVTYTWKSNVAAETEEDAIAIARNDRNNYIAKGFTEEYSAKKADFLYPIDEKK